MNPAFEQILGAKEEICGNCSKPLPRLSSSFNALCQSCFDEGFEKVFFLKAHRGIASQLGCFWTQITDRQRQFQREYKGL